MLEHCCWYSVTILVTGRPPLRAGDGLGHDLGAALDRLTVAHRAQVDRQVRHHRGAGFIGAGQEVGDEHGAVGLDAEADRQRARRQPRGGGPRGGDDLGADLGQRSLGAAGRDVAVAVRGRTRGGEARGGNDEALHDRIDGGHLRIFPYFGAGRS